MAAILTRNSHHNNKNTTTITGASGTGGKHQSSSTANTATMDSTKRVKTEDKGRKSSPLKETRASAAANKKSSSSSASPKQESSTIDSKKKDTSIATTDDAEKSTDKPTTTASTTAAPLAPPPRPTQSETNPDYFAPSHKNHLSAEPNPFEQSFGNPATETPGKVNLPPVTSLTSPAPLGTGNASLTGGFGWGGSLRSGPLSPAMLSGPQGDYFDSIRSFPTPNESSLRTGLTPGGGGSMFPAPSPGTQALFNSAFGGATPSTLDFHRAALNAASQKAPEPIVTSAPAPQPTITAPTMISSNLAQHPDNEAANGLFMLAQASAPQAPVPYSNGASNHVRNNGSVSATSNVAIEDASDDDKNTTRKSKRASAGKNSRRKAGDEPTPVKAPASKRGKNNAGAVVEKPSPEEDDDMDSDDMDMEMGDMPKDTKKMTDEEKRKNFLERNRVAALKCRQRKKQWLQNLQSKVEIYSSENDALNAQVTALRDEVINLKTILIAHKDCPIAQQQSQSGSFMGHGGVDYNNTHYANAPYGMAMQQQQAVIGGPRRSS